MQGLTRQERFVVQKEFSNCKKVFNIPLVLWVLIDYLLTFLWLKEKIIRLKEVL